MSQTRTCADDHEPEGTRRRHHITAIAKDTHERSHRRQGNKHKVNIWVDSSGISAISIEAEVDGSTNDLARDAEREPDTEAQADTVGFRVREGDSGFDGPEEACREATRRCAEEDEPFSPIHIVGVQACAVGRKACAAEEEGDADAELVAERVLVPALLVGDEHDDGSQEGGEHHQAEGQCVGGINEELESQSLPLLTVTACHTQ